MKTMLCRQLGGACDKKISGENFDEIAKKSKQHGMEMFQQNDKDHLKAMDAMKELMKTPGAIEQWFQDKKKEFDALPED